MPFPGSDRGKRTPALGSSVSTSYWHSEGRTLNWGLGKFFAFVSVIGRKPIWYTGCAFNCTKVLQICSSHCLVRATGWTDKQTMLIRVFLWRLDLRGHGHGSHWGKWVLAPRHHALRVGRGTPNLASHHFFHSRRETAASLLWALSSDSRLRSSIL